jgi:uncharacterized pyridoxamine 5'-phosphate oxidase family protein
MAIKVRHVLGISGGKDSAALAIYMHDKYPELDIEYYFCDTGKELDETIQLIRNLEIYFGKEIIRLSAIKNNHFAPFDYFYKSYKGYLPSSNARWCTKKLKLEPFEEFIGNDLAISYVGIRGDEYREGYISTKPNIQSVFPFRKNIWSIDVLSNVFAGDHIKKILSICENLSGYAKIQQVLDIIKIPKSPKFSFSKKINSLLSIDIPLFNRIVFDYLKTTTYPSSQLEDFPLLSNEDCLVMSDIFRLLNDSGIGIPAYYNKVTYEVDGQKGEYARSRSGCFFCFFQQKIEWIWLYEQHPDLFRQAMEYEKEGYTWMQEERLEDLIKPDRLKQIKLAVIKTNNNKPNTKSPYLLDKLKEAEGIVCANCFI